MPIDRYFLMKNPAIIKEARQLAGKLLRQIIKDEPKFTKDLQTIARENSAEMVGLEHKFKSPESLIRKLITESYGNLRKLLRVAESINDVLRYTFILPIQIYTDGFRRTIEHLRRSGYRVPENRIWNAWENVGSVKDRGYRGINITVISSQNRKFEIQFHTEASYELKTKTHDLYKEARLAETLPERREEIKEIVLEKAEKIEIPNGVR